MKHTLCLLAWAGLAALSANAFADTVYDNGAPRGDSGRCISNQGSCGNGVAAYDSFTLQGNTVVTGFETWSAGAKASDYANTSWSIWSSDPSAGGTPLASGKATGVSAAEGSFIATTVSGLSVNLGAGKYWLGFSHSVTGTTPWTYANSTLSTGHDAYSIEAARQFTFTTQEDPAFRIYGNGPAIPEPSSAHLMLLGLGGLLALRQNRQKARAKAV